MFGMTKAKAMFSGWSKKKSSKKEWTEDYEDEEEYEEDDDYDGRKEEVDDNEDDDEYTQDESEADRRTDDGGLKGRRKNYNNSGITFDASLVATEIEKTSVLKMFAHLRTEGSFCDVAFLCQGVLFRAHRVIVSSWSRWLRALLCEGPDEEVVALDVFGPAAFGLVLDYMYGSQLGISMENAEDIIKVVRRMEMHQLEQQCWRYLMTIINPDNCETLHDLADRYDCPPLKLAAWRTLQEAVPGYSTAPKLSQGIRGGRKPYKAVGNGLTGPGQLPVRAPEDSDDEDYEDEFEYVDEMATDEFDDSPKIFRRMPLTSIPEDDEESRSQSQLSHSDSHSQSQSGGGGGGRGTGRRRGGSSSSSSVAPSELPRDAPAAEVVNAWASRLQRVYQQCVPRNAGDYGLAEEQQHFGVFGDPQKTVNRYEPGAARRRTRGAVGPYGEAKAAEGDGAKGKSSLGSLDNKATVDWRAELRRFYVGVKMPEKIAEIDNILQTWAGQEDQMLDSLITKYRKLIPAELMKHFEHLHAHVETQTESSFVHGRR